MNYSKSKYPPKYVPKDFSKCLFNKIFVRSNLSSGELLKLIQIHSVSKDEYDTFSKKAHVKRAFSSRDNIP